MAKRQTSKNGRKQTPKDKGITAISVRGFKSLAKESRIEIRPLTILAGANSSGKSSIMQPLLLGNQNIPFRVLVEIFYRRFWMLDIKW